MEPLKNPFCLMFWQVGRCKVGYRPPGELGLAEQVIDRERQVGVANRPCLDNQSSLEGGAA